jgi:hypothetical protein
VLREKLDETNVRLTSLSQDVDGLRDSMPRSPPSRPPCRAHRSNAPAVPGATGQAAPTTAHGASASGRRRHGDDTAAVAETAYADYTAGQWSLAVQGFETY